MALSEKIARFNLALLRTILPDPILKPSISLTSLRFVFVVDSPIFITVVNKLKYMATSNVPSKKIRMNRCLSTMPNHNPIDILFGVCAKFDLGRTFEHGIIESSTLAEDGLDLRPYELLAPSRRIERIWQDDHKRDRLNSLTAEDLKMMTDKKKTSNRYCPCQ